MGDLSFLLDERTVCPALMQHPYQNPIDKSLRYMATYPPSLTDSQKVSFPSPVKKLCRHAGKCHSGRMWRILISRYR